MGWWDESPRRKKIMPFKRAWSEEECLAMRYPLIVQIEKISDL